MSKDEILEKLASIIADNTDADDISGTTDIDDLNIDSMNRTEVIMMAEEEFGIRINTFDSKVQNIRVIQDAVDYIYERLQ